MRHSIFAAAVLGFGSLSLAGCGEQAAEETAVADDTIAGLKVTNPRLIMPAVSGNPASLYFDIDYGGDKGLALRALEVENAENAALHEYSEWNFEMVMQEMGPLALQTGDRVSFEPEDRHGMVFGLAQTVEPGAKAMAYLVFAGGAKHGFEAEVRGATDDRE